MKVDHVMTPGVAVVSPEATMREAARMMDQINVGALPVCDEGRLVGIVTDRDITVRGTAAGFSADTTAVREVMTDDVRWCFDDDAVEDVEREMAAVQIRRMPVLDHGKNLVGIVALGDLATDGIPGVLDTLRRISEPSEPDRPEAMAPIPGAAGSGRALDEARPDEAHPDEAHPDEAGGLPRGSMADDGAGGSGTDLHERYQAGYGSDEDPAEIGGIPGAGPAPEAVADGVGGARATVFDRGYGNSPREGTPDRPVFDRAEERDLFSMLDPAGEPEPDRRPDARIQEELSQRLSSDAALERAAIDIAVYGSDVTLSGTVGSRRDKKRAGDIAEAVTGVEHVRNDLRVQP